MAWQQKRSFPHLSQWLLNASQKLCRCKHPTRTLGHCEPYLPQISAHAHFCAPRRPDNAESPVNPRWSPASRSVSLKKMHQMVLYLWRWKRYACACVCPEQAPGLVTLQQNDAPCVCVRAFVCVCVALCLNFSTEALPDVELLRIAEGGAARLCF